MRLLFKLSIILIIFTVSHLAIADDKSYKQSFEYIKKSNWVNAEVIANQLHDRALLKIILSQKYLNTSATFSEITSFLQKNPKWPQNDALKCKAEGAINAKTDKTEIYKWFKKNSPKTGNGYKYFALAAYDIEKDPESLKQAIKNGWIYGSFGKDEQSNYYNKFKKYLTLADNVSRIDNMLWKGSTSSAKNSMNLVNAGYKKAFEVQMSFLDMKHESKKLFKNIPKEYYTPGLVYQYISASKSDVPKVKEIVSLLLSVKNSKGHEGDFWKVQCYLAREYIEHKQFNDAYWIASNHFAVSPANVSDAEFLSGWLALRFLKKPDVAIKHFEKFRKVVKTPMSISRCLYWLARAYDAKGDDENAKKLYIKAAHHYGHTFYGQMATVELGEKRLRLPPKITLANHKNDQFTKNNDILKATKLVSKYASNCLARTYLDGLINSSNEEEEILAIALEMQHAKLHHRVWLSKKAIQKHVFIDQLSYPVPYKTKGLPIEEALTYGIIRQETVFDQFAVSSANAMGLMQLIKPTACEVAKKISLKCDVSGLTNNPNYNITLGSHYLSDTITKYQNSYILAIASYNAGPGRIAKWLNLYGDPRNFKDLHKVLDWIEMIPFGETRDYVQRVLENIQIYRVILNKEAKFQLRRDLMSDSS